MANEVTTKVKTVSMMSVQKDYITNIGKGLEEILGSMSPYQALCGYNILNKINTLLAKEGLSHQSPNVDKQSINDAIKFVIAYQLNTDNNEVFVMIRNQKVKYHDKEDNEKEKWVKAIECKPQYRGVLKIVAAYGRNVKRVYPEQIVREGDDFKYATFRGIEVVPPEWTPKNPEGKILRVIVPIEYNDGYVDYRIAERESVAVNIKAQIKQTLMGLKDKDEANRIAVLTKDKTLDELLSDSLLTPYINETYKGISAEEMLITKLVINATKRVPIEYKSAFAREIYEKTYDNSDVYEKNHMAEQLAENEIRQVEVKEDTGEVLAIEEKPTGKVEEQTLADFMED